MPEKPFRVNVYEVQLPEDADGASSTFENAITLACKASIDERLKELDGKYRRLEHCDLSGEYLLLNFITLAFDGPGRSTPQSPAVPINLEADENFSHESAMLYDPAKDLVFLESGQGGMGSGTVAKYFREFAGHREDYLLIPKLDAEASARARNHQVIRRLTMQAVTSQITSMDRDNDIGVIHSLREGYGAESIKIEFKAARRQDSSLSKDSIWRLINSVWRSSDDNDVSELKLYGREHDSDNLELIDLIQHREKRERTLDIDPGTRNVPHEARWQALVDIRKEFIS